MKEFGRYVGYRVGMPTDGTGRSSSKATDTLLEAACAWMAKGAPWLRPGTARSHQSHRVFPLTDVRGDVFNMSHCARSGTRSPSSSIGRTREGLAR